MNERQRKRWLSMTALTLASVSVVVLLAGLIVPVKLSADEAEANSGALTVGGNAANTAMGSAPAATADLTLAQIMRVASLNLRPPLFESADESPAGPGGPGGPRPRAAMALRLIGTVIEPNHSMAMFTVPSGKILVQGVGDVFEEAGAKYEVKAIEPDKATVQYGGVAHQLQMPKSPGGTGP